MSGKFALTYTVKNESRLLPSAIEYHLAAGCSRIYVFWDNTEDNAPELIARYPQVVARNSFRPDELSNLPQWLAKILPAWKPDLDVRKIANTYCAALDCAKDGIEWLGSIDADELMLMSRDEPNLEGHIPRYLEKIPEDVDQLLLRNLESIPGSAESANPFVDCVYFLDRFPVTESVWRYSRAVLARTAQSPKLIAWYDWLFYEIRFAGALKRMMREPGTGRRIPGTYFLAYSSFQVHYQNEGCARIQFRDAFMEAVREAAAQPANRKRTPLRHAGCRLLRREVQAAHAGARHLLPALSPQYCRARS